MKSKLSGRKITQLYYRNIHKGTDLPLKDNFEWVSLKWLELRMVKSMNKLELSHFVGCILHKLRHIVQIHLWVHGSMEEDTMLCNLPCAQRYMEDKHYVNRDKRVFWSFARLEVGRSFHSWPKWFCIFPAHRLMPLASINQKLLYREL